MFKLIESYASLTNDAVSPFAHGVVVQTTASQLISDGDERTANLLTAVTAYDTFINTQSYASLSNTTIADTLRNEVKRQLGRLAKQLNLDYENKEAPLQSSGLKMANPNTAQRPSGDGQFHPVITLTDGSAPGCLLISFEGFTGSVQKLGRFTTDPTLAPKHWEVFTGNSRTREIGPFDKGTEVQVMAAPLTSTTTEPKYSPVVSRIVQ